MSTKFEEEKSLTEEGEIVKKHPIYEVGVLNFSMFQGINIVDPHNWRNAKTIDIIQDVSLLTSIQFAKLSPEAENQTLCLNIDISKVNVYFSDFLLLSIIEMLFGFQDMYNKYSEEAVLEVQEEEKMEYFQEAFDNAFDQNMKSYTRRSTKRPQYKIVDAKKEEPEIDEKMMKFLKQINQKITFQLKGANLYLCERDAKTNKDIELIYFLVETIKANVILSNQNTKLNVGIKRLIVKDANLIRENTVNTHNPMPEAYSFLLSNPTLEKAILEGKNTDEDADSELLEDIQSYLKHKNSIFQLVVALKIEKADTYLDFLFNNFRFIANEKTIEKLMKFAFQILKTLDTRDNQLEKLKEEYLKYSAEDSTSNASPLKADFEITDLKEEETIFDYLRNAREKYLVREKGLSVIQLDRFEEKRRLFVSGAINDIEVWVPLDWQENTSKLMSFTFSSKLSYDATTHKNYYINSLTSLIFKVESISQQENANISLSNMDIKVETFDCSEFQECNIDSSDIILPDNNDIRTHLFKCYSIQLKYESIDMIANDEKKSAVIIALQPVRTKLGFKEIDEFKVVFDRLMKILDSLTSQNKDMVDRLKDDYNEVYEKTNEYQENKRKERGQEIVKRLAKVKKTDLLKLSLSVDSFKAALIDDTGLYHQLLIGFDVENIKAKIYLEIGQDSAESFILRRLGC